MAKFTITSIKLPLLEKLRAQIEPFVCNPKNKFYRIKNASSKMEKLPISYFVSCYFQTFFSDL